MKMDTRPAPKVLIEQVRKLARTRDISGITEQQEYTLRDDVIETMPTTWAANAVTVLSRLPYLGETEGDHAEKVKTYRGNSQPKWEDMPPDSPGFYSRHNTEWEKPKIYKVVWNQSKTRLYGKILRGDGKWSYDRGAIHLLKRSDRLTIEQAKAHGDLTGTCVCCGAELTNEESIERGVGPICFSKYF